MMRPEEKQTRREFLLESLAGAGALALGSMLPGCARFSTHSAKEPVAGETIFFVTDPALTKDGVSLVCAFDRAGRSLLSVPVPLQLGHGCFSNPGRPEQVFAVEQGGPRACSVNLASRETALFSLDSEDHDFYGHGLFLNGGEFFVTAEVNRGTKEGRIAVRRSDTLKIVDVIPSHGKNPHDLRLLHEGTVLVTANHGHAYDEAKDQESSVTFVELSSRKLLHQVRVEELGCFASHLEVVGDDEVLVACRRVLRRTGDEADRIRRELKDPSTHAVAARSQWKTIQYVEAPLYWIRGGTVLGKAGADELSRRMKNSLSLAYAPGAGVLGITHLEGEIVSFWDARTRRLLKVHELPGKGPHGLAYLESRNAFVVGLVQGLAFVDAETLAPGAGVTPAPFSVHIGKTPWTA